MVIISELFLLQRFHAVVKQRNKLQINNKLAILIIVMNQIAISVTMRNIKLTR